MNLILNLLLAILLVILGVFPNLFIVVDAGQRNWSDRLTGSGIILLIIMIAVIIFTILVEVKKDKESSDNLTMLTDIKEALEKSKLEYDPKNKTILNNNVTSNPSGNLLSIVNGGNGRVDGISMNDNSMSTTMVMEYHEFIGTLTQARIKFNIKGRQVYIGCFAGTAGRRYMTEIEKVLVENGYKIIDRIYDVSPHMDHDTKGVKVERMNGELFLIVGDLVPLQPVK